jgi:ABC-type cobalamin transport system permease subunit
MNFNHAEASSLVLILIIILFTLDSPLSKMWKATAVLSAFIFSYLTFQLREAHLLTSFEWILGTLLGIFTTIIMITFVYCSYKKGWKPSLLMTRLPKKIQEMKEKRKK